MSSTHVPKVLVVDDEDEVRRIAADLLKAEGISVTMASDGVEALAKVAADTPDIVVLDVQMPRLDGLGTLRKLRADAPEVAVIMVTGHADVSTAVAAMRLGAYDFLLKPLMVEDFVPTVQRAMERKALRGEVEDLRQHVSALEAFGDVMGPSESSRAIMQQVRRIAPSTLTIVITGETGSGKEVVARAIHRCSTRANGPLIAVDCGAIPETLVESALFGHERGAFTGADKRKDAYFQLAHGGTLFLDEIGNLPLTIQARLLRTLQERSVFPLGASRAVDVDVRIVAASNVVLQQEVRAGRFREDLYYRLAEYVIALPPLRERHEDIPHLAQRFLADMALELGRPGPEFSEAAMDVLVRHNWPGNVRELRNVVRRAALLGSELIQPADVKLSPEEAPLVTPKPVLHGANGQRRPLREIAAAAADAAERQAIVEALRSTEGNKSEAARMLQVDFKTLHLKMRRLGIAGRVLEPAPASV
ncbi:MAG: sigma-54-dependent Fis family transcriptional regulator [Candidatus Rokubacteria bacterium]|nr:sigma-54-dependent Fis family transcriptional regulator [Candidatus Rokubacteria bacterium]